ARSHREAAEALLGQLSFAEFRVQTGDDVSCLNLYKPGRPRLLGVPDTLIDRGGFQFASTEAQTPQEKANPWLLLRRKSDDGSVPVFGEQNTVMWMLHKNLGDTVEVRNGHGEPVQLRIVGLLHHSIFQSGLLMSEANFIRLYPGQS